ncbi:MAG: hypothetical protein JWM89_1320 [Acidimicrobiales bacterium]|nr:hypothetical protein [Acidimicrobiales bacterium]
MHLSAIRVRGFRASAESEIECRFPGRFAVLLGPNNGGKTTIAEALYLAHAHRFPQLPRPSVAVLGPPPREIDVEFAFGLPGEPAGELETWLVGQALGPPMWTRRLERSLGKVRAAGVENATEGADRARVVYLPAYRNPVDELARREAEILVELLRAEQQRQLGHRNLEDLRTLAESLLANLVDHSLIESVETRVSRLLALLTSGSSAHHAFIGAQVVDDSFLARVLEFLLAMVDARIDARRLEVSGLGYVNLLHLAVTLAAIPGDLDAITGSVAPTPAGGEVLLEVDPEIEQLDPAQEIEEADEAAEVEEDAFFPSDGFHVTVVVEEPEAHLHPQLQHGVLRFLRRVTLSRPELQMIVTTHSGEMLAACSPEDMVVIREVEPGVRVGRAIDHHPLQGAARRDALRKIALHFDAERSSALFADKVVLVEGVTDAVLMRVFARAWAGQDPVRVALAEALSVIAMGAVPGEWIGSLLMTPGFELCGRLAILSDTDVRDPDVVPGPPQWVDSLNQPQLGYFQSHPTLEPTLVPGNADAVAEALAAINESVEEVTPDSVDQLFMESTPRGKKGWFAFELAAGLSEKLDGGAGIAIPERIGELLEFILGPGHPAAQAGAPVEEPEEEPEGLDPADPD